MADVTTTDVHDGDEVEIPLADNGTCEKVDETNPEKKRKRDTEDDIAENVTGAASADIPNLATKFELVHKKGDLFTCSETDSLAHCVSRDLGMGKGIAVLFKRKFGGVDELKRQCKGVGDVALLKRGHRFVYYLITKEKYSGKPTYDTLKSSSIAMKRHMLENGVEKISMPRIGCGLDLLEWPKVEMLLRDIFQDTDIHITIYTL